MMLRGDDNRRRIEEPHKDILMPSSRQINFHRKEPYKENIRWRKRKSNWPMKNIHELAIFLSMYKNYWKTYCCNLNI